MSQGTDIIVCCAKTTGMVVLKTGLNVILPGLGASVDFVSAASNLYEGDYIGAAIDAGSGLFDLFTFGVFGAVKNAGQAVGKNAYIKTTKEIVKQAKKEIGEIASKEIAKGANKEVVVNIAIQSSKAAKKKLGKFAAEEIAKKVVDHAVEKAIHDATRNSVQGIVTKGVLFGAVESGGKDIFHEIYKQTLTYTAEEFAKSAPRDILKSAAAKEAEKAATQFFSDVSRKVLYCSAVKSVAVGVAQNKRQN